MLISACNPYRKIEGNKDMCRLSLSGDIDKKLVHLIQSIYKSFLYYIFRFGSINDKDENCYIKSIIENHLLRMKRI